jgi:hypothetical protein
MRTNFASVVHYNRNEKPETILNYNFGVAQFCTGSNAYNTVPNPNYMTLELSAHRAVVDHSTQHDYSRSVNRQVL